jgi:transglutaminase-like putative cysteine protease
MAARWRKTLLALSVLAAGAQPTAAAAKPRVPGWLSESASLPLPKYDPRVPAVVLHNEEILTLDEGGRVQGVARYAVRILLYEGKQFARATRSYLTDGGKIREVRAWLMRPQGDVTEYGKHDALDIAAALNDVYNEARVRVIDASGHADVGTVFGFEVSFEDRTFSGQFLWGFQGELPVVRSRFSLGLPPGWSAKALTFNHDPLPPSVTGSTSTWELSNLPWIEDEPARPPFTSIAPRLVVDAFPPEPAALRGPASFGSWTRVAAWLDELSAPSAASDAAMASKARLLVSGAPTPFDRVRAIGQYVQGLAYIAIQLGVSRGGGYRPHPAAEVFAKSYGDCKDKANLMKAMLGCVGINSYLALVRAGDPTFVRQEWPSPHQFDHCIIAVRADAESCAAAAKHPTVGSLIFFDPTDPNTPIGDLPEEEQGGLALLVMKDGGGLMRVPVIPAERNGLERRIEAELDATGAVHGSIHEQSRGREAAAERRLFRRASPAEYRRAIESWVTQGAPAATVSAITPRDDEVGGRFELALSFSAPGYAQRTGSRIMLFKPAIVSRRERLSFTERARKYPVLLGGSAYGETGGTKLPPGYDVEELPPPVSLTTSFGTYSATVEARDGNLVFTRSLRLNSMLVPVDQYDSLRTFFERVRSSELTPVVLSRR